VFIQQIPDLHQSFSLAFFYTFCFRFYRFNKLQGCGAVCVFNLRFIGFSVRGNVSPCPELSRWHSYGHVSFPFLSLFFDILHFMAELLVLLTPEPSQSRTVSPRPPVFRWRVHFRFCSLLLSLKFFFSSHFYVFDSAKLFSSDKWMKLVANIFDIFFSFSCPFL